MPSLTYGDLTDKPDTNGRYVLSCECGDHSADRGDYWMFPDSDPIGPCPECGSQVMLCTVRTVYDNVKAGPR